MSPVLDLDWSKARYTLSVFTVDIFDTREHGWCLSPVLYHVWLQRKKRQLWRHFSCRKADEKSVKKKSWYCWLQPRNMHPPERNPSGLPPKNCPDISLWKIIPVQFLMIPAKCHCPWLAFYNLLFHDFLSCSYLQHCVKSVITGHISLQTVCL